MSTLSNDSRPQSVSDVSEFTSERVPSEPDLNITSNYSLQQFPVSSNTSENVATVDQSTHSESINSDGKEIIVENMPSNLSFNSPTNKDNADAAQENFYISAHSDTEHTRNNEKHMDGIQHRNNVFLPISRDNGAMAEGELAKDTKSNDITSDTAQLVGGNINKRDSTSDYASSEHIQQIQRQMDDIIFRGRGSNTSIKLRSQSNSVQSHSIDDTISNDVKSVSSAPMRTEDNSTTSGYQSTVCAAYSIPVYLFCNRSCM